MPSRRARTSVELSRLYKRDLFEWSCRAAETLRGSQPEQADTDHLAEEIEDMGKRDLKELNSRVQVLVAHLLKWQLQTAKRSRSWSSTIVTQRIEIEADLKQSPSLKRKVRSGLPDNYEKAVRRATAETGLASDLFPAECPFTVEQILDPEFLP